jgi:hypothetical protein
MTNSINSFILNNSSDSVSFINVNGKNICIKKNSQSVYTSLSVFKFGYGCYVYSLNVQKVLSSLSGVTSFTLNIHDKASTSGSISDDNAIELLISIDNSTAYYTTSSGTRTDGLANWFTASDIIIPTKSSGSVVNVSGVSTQNTSYYWFALIFVVIITALVSAALGAFTMHEIQLHKVAKN